MFGAPLSYLKAAAAGDRRDQHHLVPILKRVRIAAEETDVFVVDVDVDELAQLAVLVRDLGGERREGLIELGQQRGKVRCVGVEFLAAIGVAREGGGKHYFDGH